MSSANNGPTPTPRISVVRDVGGRHLLFIEATSDLDEVLTTYAPRWQKKAYKGAPITIHHDTQLGMLRFSPMILKDGLNPPRYLHVSDLQERNEIEDDSDDYYVFKDEDDEDEEEDTEDEDEDSAMASQSEETFQQASPEVTETSSNSQAHVKRPANSWILYRCDKSKELHRTNPGMSAGDVSTEVSRRWKLESQVVREFYQTMADDIKAEFKRAHPDYKYKPRKPSEVKRRSKKTQAQTEDVETDSEEA